MILIGYQNDYFADDGVLRPFVEDADRVASVKSNTLELLRRLVTTPVMLVATPIIFTHDYTELVDPVGILKAIRDRGAFRAGARGSETIDELSALGRRILEVPGKRGLNAFTNTSLGPLLDRHGITDVVLAGAVTSICIDSTGRAAFEAGYRVHVLKDATCGRSGTEQTFYCSEVFPLYAQVLTCTALIERLGLPAAARND